MFHAFFLSFWSGFCRSWWFFASVERGSGSVKVKVCDKDNEEIKAIGVDSVLIKITDKPSD